jgi:hypothetical protein
MLTGKQGTERMAEITDAAVEKRAKALSERDGFAWQLEYQPVNPGAKIKGQVLVSEEQREQYLAQARGELRKETDNA